MSAVLLRTAFDVFGLTRGVVPTLPVSGCVGVPSAEQVLATRVPRPCEVGAVGVPWCTFPCSACAELPAALSLVGGELPSLCGGARGQGGFLGRCKPGGCRSSLPCHTILGGLCLWLPGALCCSSGSAGGLQAHSPRDCGVSILESRGRNFSRVLLGVRRALQAVWLGTGCSTGLIFGLGFIKRRRFLLLSTSTDGSRNFEFCLWPGVTGLFLAREEN